ncbi:MAG: C_GCAxxG_C_C family protein [Clostridiales bacterium]|nr:C_GCAxxG_C_C family protein [Clostridiales bacterium]
MDEISFKIFQLASMGFCCSQIILKMALDEEEKENPDLIRVMGGLCNGIGGNQGTCGVLIGGIGILGLYAGKGIETEYPKPNYGNMVKEYMDWFEDEFESINCIDLIGEYNFSENIQYPVKCGDILLKNYEKIREILHNEDYEWGYRDDE